MLTCLLRYLLNCEINTPASLMNLHVRGSCQLEKRRWKGWKSGRALRALLEASKSFIINEVWFKVMDIKRPPKIEPTFLIMNILVHGKNLAIQDSVGLNEFKNSQQKVAWNSLNCRQMCWCPNKSVSQKRFHQFVNHRKKLCLRHPLPMFDSFSFFQASIWLGLDKAEIS